MKPQSSKFALRRPALLASGAVILASLVWVLARKPAAAAPTAAVPAIPSSAAVSASGRIEPSEAITHVAAPNINGRPAIIAKLNVREGESVREGQVIAVLAGKQQLEAAMRQAEARMNLDQVKLDQLRAAPRGSDLAAQNAEVARWQAALDNAQAEYKRYESLQANHDVSVSELDAKRAEMENAHRMTEQARARLAGLSEVRPDDVRFAESALQASRAELERARLDLASAELHSPADGVVLHVHAKPGEEVGQQGVLELAKTAEMCVIAEVYETDIRRVKTGQSAEVQSELLPGKTLKGTVATIGHEIGRADLAPTDPATFADSRVVLVVIRLTDSREVAGLIHGKVSVVIQP